MQLSDNRSRLAGLPDGLDNGQLGRLASDGYNPIIPHSADCQNWRRYCFAQVARYINLAERWLDLSEATP